MPKNIQTTIDGDRAHIAPQTPEALGEAIGALLDVAEDPAVVETSTEGPGLLQIRVPASLAREAGLVDDAEDDDDEKDETPTTGSDSTPEGTPPPATIPVADPETPSETPVADPEPELTPSQKAARTRRENEAKARAEAQAKADAADAADASNQ